MTENGKPAKRGFAAINPNRRREIASKGGLSAHAKGTAHKFTPSEAKEAGRLGGKKTGQNKAHMSKIGRIGGKSSREGKDGKSEHENSAAAAETY